MSQLIECQNCVKACSACKAELPLDCFYTEKSGRSAGRYSSRCKPCMIKSSAEWAERNRDAKRRHARRSSYKRKYGVSLEWVEEGFAKGCELCGSTTQLAVDHCHATGEVRGVLCITCNTALERVERDGWIESAKEYLCRN